MSLQDNGLRRYCRYRATGLRSTPWDGTRAVAVVFARPHADFSSCAHGADDLSRNLGRAHTAFARDFACAGTGCCVIVAGMRRIEREEALAALRAFYERYGRTPLHRELGGRRGYGLPGPQWFLVHCGGVPSAFRMAGLPLRRVGVNLRHGSVAHIPKCQRCRSWTKPGRACVTCARRGARGGGGGGRSARLAKKPVVGQDFLRARTELVRELEQAMRKVATKRAARG